MANILCQAMGERKKTMLSYLTRKKLRSRTEIDLADNQSIA